jgi:hypothetical protein
LHTTAVSFKMTAATESLPKRHLALAFDAYSLWPRTITDVVPPKGPPSGKICLIAAMNVHVFLRRLGRVRHRSGRALIVYIWAARDKLAFMVEFTSISE